MAGVVLETLSWRKLVILAVFLFTCALVFFVIGGVVAPHRSNSITTAATFCIEHKTQIDNKWFLPNGNATCPQLDSLDDEEEYNGGISIRQVVFTFWLPPIRDGQKLEFSRWFQTMNAVLQMGILSSDDIPLGKDAKVTLEDRIGYRDEGDSSNDTVWNEISISQEQRTLKCQKGRELHDLENNTWYTCEVRPFFQLATVHHDYYLLNVRVPVRPYEDINMHIGKLRNMTLTVSYQSAVYTQVWLYTKTLLFPLVLVAVAWFWRRVQARQQASLLLERTTFALGIVISLLNLPIEYFTLVADIPSMILINEGRQTLYIGLFMCFSIIFIGEHLCQWSDGNFLTDYWKRLFAIFTGCFLFMLFKVCERGVIMSNPFDSIWMTETSTRVSLGILIGFGSLLFLYFVYLCCITVKLFRHSGDGENNYRGTYAVGLKCVLVMTLLCMATTIAYLVLYECWEGQMKWATHDLGLDNLAAFWIGVYGLWNVHLITILSLFAPSNKPQRPSDEGAYGLVSEGEPAPRAAVI